MSDGSWLRELLTSGRERIVDIEGITDVLDMSEDVRLRTAAAAERDVMVLVVAGCCLTGFWILVEGFDRSYL